VHLTMLVFYTKEARGLKLAYINLYCFINYIYTENQSLHGEFMSNYFCLSLYMFVL
jgi:hypothetical protein